jgi:hypothetical protein
MKSPAAEYSGFVEHPRYGKGPRFTGLDVADSPDGRVYCHWHSPMGVRVPNTAVVADVARQRTATLHVTHYFDAKRVCRVQRPPSLRGQVLVRGSMFPLRRLPRLPPCRKDEQRLEPPARSTMHSERQSAWTDTLEL